jgi:hypothetical protein
MIAIPNAALPFVIAAIRRREIVGSVVSRVKGITINAEYRSSEELNITPLIPS